MSVFTRLGVNIAAPTDAAGNPRRPVNQDFQVWMTEAERLFYALIAGQGGDVDLPNLLISYTITGGTENAIEATANLPVPDAAGEALFSIRIAQDNTGPVTINGKPLLTNSGNEIAAGGIVGGGIYLFLDDGTNYRLLSDQVSDAIVAAAEAAQVAAEDAKAAAEQAAGSVQFPVSYGISQSLSPSQRLQAQANIGLNMTYLSKVVTPKQFGGVGDGAADDSDPVQEAMETGKIVEWGDERDIYRLTRTIAPTLTADVNWRSGGAELLFDPSSNLRRAIYINQAVNVYTEGPLTLDANRKAFMGWVLSNTGEIKDITAKDLRVRNVYRASLDFDGGDGIYIAGSWYNVTLENPDVRNCLMAPGAQVPLVQGIFGITIRGSSAAMPQPIPGKYTIINPYVDTVMSEDTSHAKDNDGIRMLDLAPDGTVFPYATTFQIIGGKFVNCKNRAIKSQLRYGSVVGTQFVRDWAVLGPKNVIGGDEINFQNGGGLVSDCEFHYKGALPRTLVGCDGRVESGEHNGAGAVMRSCRANIFDASSNLGSVMEMRFRESKSMFTSISGLTVQSQNNILSIVNITSPNDTASKEAHVHLSDIAAPVASGGTNAFVKRTGGVDAYVSGRNLSRNLDSVVGTARSVASLFYTDTPGSITKQLSGVNKRVVDA